MNSFCIVYLAGVSAPDSLYHSSFTKTGPQQRWNTPAANRCCIRVLYFWSLSRIRIIQTRTALLPQSTHSKKNSGILMTRAPVCRRSHRARRLPPSHLPKLPSPPQSCGTVPLHSSFGPSVGELSNRGSIYSMIGRETRQKCYQKLKFGVWILVHSVLSVMRALARSSIMSPVHAA